MRLLDLGDVPIWTLMDGGQFLYETQFGMPSRPSILQIYMTLENYLVQRENSPIPWPFSMAMLVIIRGYFTIFDPM